MSRQFRMYLLPSDADALVRELSKHVELKIFQEDSPTPEPIELKSPVRNRSIPFNGVQASSINCYLAPSNGARIDINFYRNPDRWIIDSSSEAIEFSGCDFNGAILLIGRFYFQTDELVDGAIYKKRSEFTNWADTVFRYAKKFLYRNSELDAYVGEDAIAFRKQGGRFASSIKSNGEPVYESLPN